MSFGRFLSFLLKYNLGSRQPQFTDHLLLLLKILLFDFTRFITTFHKLFDVYLAANAIMFRGFLLTKRRHGLFGGHEER